MSAVTRVLRWAGREFLHLLPAIIYFFVAFTMLLVNEQLVLEKIDLGPAQLLRPVVGALVVAKILLVANMFPPIRAFDRLPLAWGTAWRTLVYMAFAIVFQLAETVVMELVGGTGLAGSLAKAGEEAGSYRFILIQVWLVVLLASFITLQQLVNAVGAAKVRQLFLGTPAA